MQTKFRIGFRMMMLIVGFVLAFVLPIQGGDAPQGVKERLKILNDGIKSSQAKLQSGYGAFERETVAISKPDKQPESASRLGAVEKKGPRNREIRFIEIRFQGSNWRWSTYLLDQEINGNPQMFAWPGGSMRCLAKADGHWKYDGSQLQVYSPESTSAFGRDNPAVLYVEISNPLKGLEALPVDRISITKQKRGTWDCEAVTVRDKENGLESTYWICPQAGHLPVVTEQKKNGKITHEGFYTPKKYGDVWYYEKWDKINYSENEEISWNEKVRIVQFTFSRPIEPSVFTPQGLGASEGTECLDYRADEKNPQKKILGKD